MKIVNIEDISALDAKTVVTVGMFDGLHLGHRHLVAHLMERAAGEGLEPVVVTFDSHPRLVVEPEATMALLSTREERLQQLEECGVRTVALIHFTRETAQMGACAFVRYFLCGRLNMRVLLLGYDNRFGSRKENDFDRLPELASELGFSICRDEAVLLDGVEVSSTKIRRALSEGDLRLANAMLGAPYSLGGRVVHGRHEGRSLGFPTANVQPDDRHKMLPAAGVYALRATVEGRSYAAMANLGGQPTFNSSSPVLEVHLIGFEGDIYGRFVKVEFIERLRDIRRFDTPEALRSQLERDKSQVLKCLKNYTEI